MARLVIRSECAAVLAAARLARPRSPHGIPWLLLSSSCRHLIFPAPPVTTLHHPLSAQGQVGLGDGGGGGVGGVGVGGGDVT